MKPFLLLTIACLALPLTGCRNTIPADTSILVGGKNPTSVAIGGMTWEQALRQIGQVALRVGGKIAVSAGTTYIEDKLKIKDSGK